MNGLTARAALAADELDCSLEAELELEELATEVLLLEELLIEELLATEEELLDWLLDKATEDTLELDKLALLEVTLDVELEATLLLFPPPPPPPPQALIRLTQPSSITD